MKYLILITSLISYSIDWVEYEYPLNLDRDNFKATISFNDYAYLVIASDFNSYFYYSENLIDWQQFTMGYSIESHSEIYNKLYLSAGNPNGKRYFFMDGEFEQEIIGFEYPVTNKNIDRFNVGFFKEYYLTEKVEGKYPFQQNDFELYNLDGDKLIEIYSSTMSIPAPLVNIYKNKAYLGINNSNCSFSDIDTVLNGYYEYDLNGFLLKESDSLGIERTFNTFSNNYYYSFDYNDANRVVKIYRSEYSYTDYELIYENEKGINNFKTQGDAILFISDGKIFIQEIPGSYFKILEMDSGLELQRIDFFQNQLIAFSRDKMYLSDKVLSIENNSKKEIYTNFNIYDINGQFIKETHSENYKSHLFPGLYFVVKSNKSTVKTDKIIITK